MKKALYISLATLILLNSCAKSKKYYSEYKKSLGLNDAGTYLLDNRVAKSSFKNVDLKIEKQNFEETNNELAVNNDNKDKEIEVTDIKEKKEEQKIVDANPEFTKYTAIFNSDRHKLKIDTDVQRAPASITPYYENPYYKAQALVKKGRFKDAETNFKIYIKDNSNDALHMYPTYLGLAELCMYRKDYLSATNYYHEILENKYENTNYELVYFKLYESYTNMGRSDIAEKYADKIKEKNPNSNYFKLIK